MPVLVGIGGSENQLNSPNVGDINESAFTVEVKVSSGGELFWDTAEKYLEMFGILRDGDGI